MGFYRLGGFRFVGKGFLPGLIHLIQMKVQLPGFVFQLFLIRLHRFFQGRQFLAGIDNILKGRDVGFLQAVIFDGQIHAQLVGHTQTRHRIAQLACSAMGGLITFDTNVIDVIDETAIDTVGKNRRLDHLMHAGLRHSGEALFLVNGLHHFFGKCAQAGQCTARVDVEYGFGQPAHISQ